MTRTDLLSKLFQALAHGDVAGAKAIGARIAAGEEEKGHHTAAQLLRGALNPNGQRLGGSSSVASVDATDPTAFMTGALMRASGPEKLADVQLRPAQRHELEAVVDEWKHRQALAHARVRRRRKLLFHGPPGCGKSLTAVALGNELGLPAFVVRVDAVVGAFLGQTALRIRELFNFAERTACVLVLDEVDALGKRRGNQLDVGELDRVVISLMQGLEHSDPRGLLIAASNLPSKLDDALFRRFDLVLQFPKPSAQEIQRFSSERAAKTHVISSSNARRLVRTSASYADAVRRIEDAERSALLGKLRKKAR